MLIYCVFSMKISKISDEHFSNYNMLPNGNEEIDLFDLIREGANKSPNAKKRLCK